MSTKKSSLLSRVSRAQNENASNQTEAGAKPIPTRNRLALKDVTNNPAAKGSDENVKPKNSSALKTVGRNGGT